jgi:hypothetical protein
VPDRFLQLPLAEQAEIVNCRGAGVAVLSFDWGEGND